MLNKVKHFNYQKGILTVLFFVFIFFLTRQVPFVKYSVFMNISLLGLFLVSTKSIINILNKSNIVVKYVFIIHILFLLFLLFYAIIVINNEIVLAFRFFLILLLISLAYFVNLPERIIWIFLSLYLIQALFIIIVGVCLPLFFNTISYLPIRNYVINSGWGDIFTLNGWFYRVQLRGNYLIPFAYFIVYFLKQNKVTQYCKIIFFLGTIFAGNFAFLISIFIFHLSYFFLKTKSNTIFYRKILVLMVLVFITIKPVTTYISSVLEIKSTISLNLRWEQADILLDDFTSTIPETLLGRGLGNLLKIKTNSRNYEDSTYYEMQSLYFLNQTGLCYFTFFLIVNIIFCVYFFKRRYELYLLYGCYIIYAVTNPYIFDTNQVTVIFLLCTLARLKNSKIYI